MLQLDLTQAQSSIPTPIPQEAAEKARQSLLDGQLPRQRLHRLGPSAPGL